MDKLNETRLRSGIKAIVWRIIASLSTIGIVLVLSGELVLSLEVGLIEFIIKIVLYYVHERIWEIVKWRKRK